MKKTNTHRKAWKLSTEAGETNCFWCQRRFKAPDLPPTIDHKVPKSLGGIIKDGLVFACQTCNSARGNIPFEEYLVAVEMEHVMCKIEKRSYRWPKRRRVAGKWTITTMSKKQIRLAEANAAVSEIEWIEPHDVAQDKKWERETT